MGPTLPGTEHPSFPLPSLEAEGAERTTGQGLKNPVGRHQDGDQPGAFKGRERGPALVLLGKFWSPSCSSVPQEPFEGESAPSWDIPLGSTAPPGTLRELWSITSLWRSNQLMNLQHKGKKFFAIPRLAPGYNLRLQASTLPRSQTTAPAIGRRPQEEAAFQILFLNTRLSRSNRNKPCLH